MLPIHCGISRILYIVPEATLRVLFNWASNKINLGVLWFCFTSLCKWSRKRAPLTLIHLDSSLIPVATGPPAFSCSLSRLFFLPSQRTRQSGTLTNPLTQDINGLTRDINGLTRNRPENIPCRNEIIARRPETLDTFCRPRQQRGRGKTKELMGRTKAQHVLFETVYIS